MAALQELDLDPASDTMSVEDQIAANTATLKNALALVEEELTDAIQAEGLADRIARERMIQKAIDTSVTAQTDMAHQFPTGIASVMATRNAAGMVTVDVNGDVADDYMDVDGETIAGSGDWNGVTMTSGTNTLVVYTDIEAPSDKDFNVAYPGTLLDDALSDNLVAKAMSDGFPSVPGTTWEYGADGGRATTVTGAFDGVPGDFTCTSTMATCTVSIDLMGKLKTSPDWRFTADFQNTATVKDPDVAYAYFGWWLDKPEDNMATHMTEVFAGAVGDPAANATLAIEGNATYVGPAAGKYATKSYSAGVQTDAAVGHFTASTTLTAKFLGGDGGDAGTIGGSVTGFELDDGATPAWSVKLEDATLDETANDFNGVSLATFGPTSKVEGVWEGAFFDADTTDPTNAPGTVVGTFSAVSDSASLLGAFGATKR